MRALFTATAILLVAVPAVAQPKKLKQADISATRLHVVDTVSQSRTTKSASPNSQVHAGATGWTFDVLTLYHAPAMGVSTVTHAPYGVFTSRDECEMARAKKTAELDEGNYRYPHLLPNAPVYTTTITVGARSITTEKPGGPTETKSVADCHNESFSAVRQTAQQN
jgi:hypothetical protein